MHIVLSCWLALLLLFGGTAKEFIHLFTAHEDTVHHSQHEAGLAFENEHHHCSFLSFSLQPFDGYKVILLPALEEQAYTVCYVSLVSNLPQQPALLVSLRGPPLI